MATEATPVEILLVEDNPADVRLTQEALKASKVCNRLSVVRDGLDCMDFLLRRGEHSDSPRPDLILLDLNLPRKDGREVLQEIKGTDELKSIPVVVLTTSGARADIEQTYASHANCYLTKPLDLDDFIHVVKLVDDFWLSLVKLPRRD